ncbi:MAG TPA: helix-turn-helix domain-containing protein [Thermoanaerobaculia bacterium]|nr:helix-turn-helix domain-containing protein [Thermoanaerobaculia bacterium]
MAKYKQYCPVARASEIVADRWTPLIVRELLAGSRHFNEIERGLPGISRSLLVARLRHLEKNGVVERRVSEGPATVEYLLTEAGEDLRRVVEQFGAWGVRWAFGEPRADELDPVLLLWKVHQRINREVLPERRTTVEFDFTGRNGRRLWLVLEPHDVSVCLKPPGFDPDLHVRADLRFFYRVWLGHVDYDAAVRCGGIAVEGSPALARALPRWFLWSPMAKFVRALEPDARESRRVSIPRSEPGGVVGRNTPAPARTSR